MGAEHTTLLQQAGQTGSLAQLPPATSIQDFEIIRTLGQGTFATVFLVRRYANNQLYAIKVIKKQLIIQSNELEHTNAELSILMQLNHPFLIRLHGAFQNAENLYLVLDFMQGGELFHHIQKHGCFSEKTAQFITAQLILALQELHSRQIIMRDLKPENILMDNDGYVKITDFGLSKLSNNGLTVHGNTFCGTAEYLSPEQLRNQQHGVEVDYWALGVICYELIQGIPPFYNREHKQMFKNILKAEVSFNDKFSLNCQSFIKACLERDPRRRIGAGGNVQQLKQHQWFQKIDWERLYNKQYQMEYKPQQHLNRNNVDLSNFDNRFTQQQINIQEIMDIDNMDIQNNGMFPGFDIDSRIADKIVQQRVDNAIEAQNAQEFRRPDQGKLRRKKRIRRAEDVEEDDEHE